MKLAGHVRWCDVEGVIVVLDVIKGEYFALAPEITQSWLGAVRGYGTLPADTFNMVADHGWIAGAGTPDTKTSNPIGARPKTPGIIFAIRCMVSARMRLRFKGFSNAYRWAQGQQTPPRPARYSLEQDLDVFVRAEAWMPSARGDRDCLPRSLALFVYLKSLGHRVKHVIGVARFPFDAHAWVTHEGEPLLEFRPEQELLLGARQPVDRTTIAVLE